MGEKIWVLTIEADEKEYEQVAGVLAMYANYGWEEKDLPESKIQFKMYGRDGDALNKVGVCAAEVAESVSFFLDEVERKDWASAWKQFFTPVECGSQFVVLPPWLAHMEHSTRKAVIIDPKNAFGTGHHATTALCLTALSNLLDEGRLRRHNWFLDLGCGSGVLGLAACKAGLDGTGLDIDPEAIANARENRELNEASRLELLKGGIEKIKGEKFDLIMANILAQPLIDMAPKIVAALKPAGTMILSGILDKQAQDVIAAYKACGLKDPEIMREGEWAALIWKQVERNLPQSK